MEKQMKIEGEIGIMVRSFYASPEEMNWTLALRRKDKKSDPAFAQYHKQVVPPEFLRKLLPDWESLKWTELKVPDQFPRELKAESRLYELHIIIVPKSNLTVDEVVSQFKKVISSSFA